MAHKGELNLQVPVTYFCPICKLLISDFEDPDNLWQIGFCHVCDAYFDYELPEQIAAAKEKEH
jgi:hypothetical protein